jgi:hypothetical protein
MEDQLRTCVESFLELSVLMRGGGHLSHELIKARNNLFSMLFTIHCHLNSMRYVVGSICYAPRLADGVMDLALIVSKCDDEMCSISWIYPRNIYELSSNGIRIGIDRLQLYTAEKHAERVLDLENLSHDALVLVQNENGIFIPGKMSKRLTRGLSLKDERILEIISENTFTSRISTFTVPEDLLVVVPFYSTIKISSSQQLDVESESTEGSEEDSLIIYDIYSPRSSDGLRGLQDSNNLLGDWERHTKGVGGRLLRKMGYKRHRTRLLTSQPHLPSGERDWGKMDKVEFNQLMR